MPSLQERYSHLTLPDENTLPVIESPSATIITGDEIWPRTAEEKARLKAMVTLGGLAIFEGDAVPTKDSGVLHMITPDDTLQSIGYRGQFGMIINYDALVLAECDDALAWVNSSIPGAPIETQAVRKFGRIRIHLNPEAIAWVENLRGHAQSTRSLLKGLLGMTFTNF